MLSKFTTSFKKYGFNLSGAMNVMNVVHVNVRHNVRQSRRVNGRVSKRLYMRTTK